MVNLWVGANTDGILVKLYDEQDKEKVIGICEEWSKRTRMNLEYDEYSKVYQRDVNNYLIIDKNGHYKSKGAVVKKLSKLDYHLPIVNKAVVNYLINGTPVEKTINNCEELMEFQFITKITDKYDYCIHNGKILSEKVHRCFASLDKNDGTLYKKHKNKTTFDKTAGTPEHCFIENSNIIGKKVIDKLDKMWYINTAKEKLKDFIGG